MEKLNIGCGNKIMPGFVNLDILELPGVDCVSPADSLPFEKDRFDYVYACHILEHFSRHKIDSVLEEWVRVLKPGGMIRIAVPDFEAATNWYRGNNIGEILGLVCGGQRDEFDYHKVVFDERKLRWHMEMAGLNKVQRYDWRTTEHGDQDDFSQAYLPHMNKSTGTLMSLNMQGIKA